MYSDEQISDFDVFYYYGQLPIDLETQSDVTGFLIQPKRQLFYNRREGAGVTQYENVPQSVVMLVTMMYGIMNSNAYRNSTVTDGTNGTIDRRVAMSQSAISVKNDGQGNTSVSVEYIRMADLVKSTVKQSIRGVT